MVVYPPVLRVVDFRHCKAIQKSGRLSQAWLPAVVCCPVLNTQVVPVHVPSYKPQKLGQTTVQSKRTDSVLSFVNSFLV